jgi:hypothetical protein
VGGRIVITRNVQFEATNPKAGLTLDELAVFVNEARHDGIPGDTIIKVRVNFKGGIRRVETK